MYAKLAWRAYGVSINKYSFRKYGVCCARKRAHQHRAVKLELWASLAQMVSEMHARNGIMCLLFHHCQCNIWKLIFRALSRFAGPRALQQAKDVRELQLDHFCFCWVRANTECVRGLKSTNGYLFGHILWEYPSMRVGVHEKNKTKRSTGNLQVNMKYS